MACPTCDHTMHNIGRTYHQQYESLFWCERCGTIKLGFEGTPPKLVGSIKEFAGKLTDDHQDLIDEFERLGIRDSIVIDSGMI